MNVRRFAVIGDPISQSKSPTMHAAAYRALGVPHIYEALRVSAPDLPHALSRLRDGTYDGFNVTVPHKERVLEWVDHLDASARQAGAANTLVRDPEGRLIAYNTDAPALEAELQRLAGKVAPWAHGRALVLGAGGAARAAIAAFGQLGVRDIVVRARGFVDSSRAAAFASTAPFPVTVQSWQPSPDSEASTLAVVQATSAGMLNPEGGREIASLIAWDALAHDAVAIDVVYAPPETPWLRAARARGLRADGGLGMLAGQGALALELWLGCKAPVAAMRAALE